MLTKKPTTNFTPTFEPFYSIVISGRTSCHIPEMLFMMRNMMNKKRSIEVILFTQKLVQELVILQQKSKLF